MTVIINRKTYEVKDEKEAKELANGRSYTIKEGISYRIVMSNYAVEEMIRENRKVRDNKQ